MAYDPNNIFAKILRKEIPCSSLYEDPFALAFNDIHPKAPVHVLVIPKGAYVSADDFYADASPEEVTGFYRAVAKVLKDLNLEDGYRLLSNCGVNAGQEVPHFHIHILAGKKLGPMLAV